MNKRNRRYSRSFELQQWYERYYLLEAMRLMRAEMNT
jgi:hypothetical protein